MIRFEAYKGGLFKADLAEGVWIYFHSRCPNKLIKFNKLLSELLDIFKIIYELECVNHGVMALNDYKIASLTEDEIKALQSMEKEFKDKFDDEIILVAWKKTKS